MLQNYYIFFEGDKPVFPERVTYVVVKTKQNNSHNGIQFFVVVFGYAMWCCLFTS